jgi:hypothetical protein
MLSIQNDDDLSEQSRVLDENDRVNPLQIKLHPEVYALA